MADKKQFNLSTPVGEQDQRVVKGNAKLNRKQTEQQRKLRKAHQGAGAKLRTGSGE